MHTQWLTEQSEALRRWLTSTHCPMLASLEDGTIVWANTAFEELLNYTVVELTGHGSIHGVSWKDLTVNSDDLNADLALIESLKEGHRNEYRLQKSYRKKNGEPVPVLIQVLRWPPAGDVEVYLVTILPLNISTSYLLSEFQSMNKLLVQVLQTNQCSFTDRFVKWAAKNKFAATVLILFVTTFLFGDRVMEIAGQIKSLLDGVRIEHRPPAPLPDP